VPRKYRVGGTAATTVGPPATNISGADSGSHMVEELAPSEVAAKLKGRPTGVVLLDVREPYEREIARIEPSIHIPMGEIAGRTDELPKDREIVVYCHGGVRSAMVAGYLEAKGFSPVSNLSGGIDAWSVRVDPKVPRYS
jgi:rhodanese-related sulfurtransferase